jgi:pimeloyl-ACP methyl ester carboxylesterase
MLTQKSLQVDGVTTTVVESSASKAPLVFLHGGVPGVSPFCSGSHIWGGCLERFAAERGVLALDLPGSAGTGLPKDGMSIESIGRHIRASLAALGIERCYMVGHDLGGLLALLLAAETPELVRGVTAVSSLAAAPTGDSVENLTLAHPPPPPWSRHSQRWALERLSYSHHHIGEALLDACVAAGSAEPHRSAQKAMAAGAYSDVFLPGLAGAKARFYEICRGAGIAVPVQVVWGTHDPLGTVDQGIWLFRIVAARQSAAQFHLINRAGYLPFREEPEAFHQMVSGFCDAVFPG